MKDRSDFELELPTSLREIVEDEISAGDTKPPDEGIDELMQRVYARIESQALRIYKSNESWALRAYCLSTILKDTVADEATVPLADELMSSVVEWQNKQPFDPINYFQEQLTRKSPKTVKGYLITASRFVALIGRKRYYTDEDVKRYLKYADKIYDNNNTYHQECVRLLQFLRRLPGTNENRRLPIDPPKIPKKKKYTYAFPFDDIETLIWATVIDDIPYDMVVRLIGATIYGRRVGELTNFEVNLNGANSTILFQTRKGGEEVAHPLPQSLVPLFSMPIKPISEYMLQRTLRQICKKAGVSLPYRGGFHSFRRTVATVVKHSIKSDIDTHKFMRWAEPRELSILAQYDQTRYEDVDKLVLDNHPMVKIWEQACPHLLKLNTNYQGVLYDNAH